MTETKPVEEQVENLAPVEAQPETVEPITETAEEGAPIPRKHVTEIVKRERLAAYHKAKREFMSELEATQAQQLQTQAPVQPQAVTQGSNLGLGGMQQALPADIQKMIAAAVEASEQKIRQEVSQKEQFSAAQKIAENFNSQMANGRAKRPDFDEKMKDIDFAALSPLAHLAANTGMADDIMYDLVENPQKITHLMLLAHTQPKLAEREMQKLAASIKANSQALDGRAPVKAPLSQITPSNVGTDNGQMSVKDYQKMFR